LERYSTDGIAASALRDDIAILALRIQRTRPLAAGLGREARPIARLTAGA
jgi:hypothetical protein